MRHLVGGVVDTICDHGSSREEHRYWPILITRSLICTSRLDIVARLVEELDQDEAIDNIYYRNNYFVNIHKGLCTTHSEKMMEGVELSTGHKLASS